MLVRVSGFKSFRAGCKFVDSSAYSNRAKHRTCTITPHIAASACSITAPYKRSLVSPIQDERILSTRAITKMSADEERMNVNVWWYI